MVSVVTNSRRNSTKSENVRCWCFTSLANTPFLRVLTLGQLSSVLLFRSVSNLYKCSIICQVCSLGHVPYVSDESFSHCHVGETETCFLAPVNTSEASFQMLENAFSSSLTNFISLTLGHLTVSFAQADSSVSVIHKKGSEFVPPRWTWYDCVA